jgi:hypothetical protein
VFNRIEYSKDQLFPLRVVSVVEIEEVIQLVEVEFM